MKKSIDEQWKDICDEYVVLFCKKHDISIDYELNNGYVWVGNNPGTIACIGDMFIDMSTLRYDVDAKVPDGYFSKWYWTNVERAEMNLRYMNYESFCNGCPDPIPADKLIEIKENRKKVAEAKKVLENLIKDYKNEENLIF